MADGSFLDLDVDVVELAAYVPPAAPAGALREVGFRANSWLPHEIDTLRAMFAADASIEEIVASLGRPRAGVADKIYVLGLRRNSRRPWTELEDAEILKRYGTVSAAVLAQELGRACSALYTRAQVLGVSGENAAPYSAWEDTQIRVGFGLGMPVTQVAALIGRPWYGVNSYASKHGIRNANHPPGWAEDELARALELAYDGVRYLEIIEILHGEGYPRRTKAGLGPMLRKLGYGRGWGRAFSTDEDELLKRAYAAGDNLRRFAASLGRTHHSLKWRAETLGLTGSHPKPNGFRQGPDWTEEELKFLRENYARMKPAAIAKELGRKKAGVFTKAWNLGLKTGYWRAFSPEEDLAIRIGARHGLNASKIGRALGRVSRCVNDRAVEYLGVELVKGKGGKRRGPEYTLEQILALEGLRPAAAANRPDLPRRVVRRIGVRRARRRFGFDAKTTRRLKRLAQPRRRA